MLKALVILLQFPREIGKRLDGGGPSLRIIGSAEQCDCWEYEGRRKL